MRHNVALCGIGSSVSVGQGSFRNCCIGTISNMFMEDKTCQILDPHRSITKYSISKMEKKNWWPVSPPSLT